MKWFGKGVIEFSQLKAIDGKDGIQEVCLILRDAGC